jgi:hypothetical protein
MYPFFQPVFNVLLYGSMGYLSMYCLHDYLEFQDLQENVTDQQQKLKDQHESLILALKASAPDKTV